MLTPWVLVGALLGQALCPAAQNLPWLHVDHVTNPPFSVGDSWQIYLDNVVLSDMQLASLAGDSDSIEGLRQDMQQRGSLVYAGMLASALGTGVSSVGWALLGGIEQNQLSQSTALSLALGGLVVGLAGVLLVTDSIQSTLEPHLAPVPHHRLSRDEVHRLIGLANRRWQEEICSAGHKAASLGQPEPIGSAP